MNPLRSVGARLSLALVLVVAAALGTVYLGVVPSLQRNLEQAKLAQLRQAARTIGDPPVDDFASMPDFLERASASANARIVVYSFFGTTPEGGVGLITVGDSNGITSTDVADDTVADQAARTLREAEGVRSQDGRAFAEVAVPVGAYYVTLLRSPLHDALGNVHLVRRRLLEAGILALLVSLAVGYGAASLFARRLRRLERAAERIAAGDFGEPVVDHGRDEVGQLARAFERMRGRLAQLDHARREFIANASHELRTPLFSLGGFLELLDDEGVDEATRREFLATMREQVERLTKLATELLDLSRLDAGRLRVTAGRVELAELAGALVEEFRGVSLARDRRLALEIAEEAAAVGDAERVFQIGRILLENALVHTPPGSRIAVRVGLRAGRAELAVEDDGPGIPPEHAPHVFERFYRIDGAVASGSGLGLAIARELAALMGGTLELTAGDSGARFSLLLSVAEPVAGGAPALHVKTTA